MEKPIIEALPASREQLEKRWPKLLAAIAEESKTPADPEKLEADLRNNPDFMALVNGWEDMPTTSQANAWEMLQDRLWEAVRLSRTFCVRCGECCRRGSPVLYDQDRPSLAKGAIKHTDIVTLRRGEPAYSNRAGRIIALDCEQVKLKSAPDNRTCIFLSPGGDACLVYEDRPFQCRILECWDPSRFDTLLKLPPLSRLDLLGKDNPLEPIIRQHDEKCSLDELAQKTGKDGIDDESIREKVMEMILYDLHVREFVIKKFQLSTEVMDFILGRPLAYVCQGFGYKFEVKEDGRPELSRNST